mmetsp:Transcript_12242/g.22220  ORF Transcript_12242/g.22220 Transcript_12242/m.22220 type:complete len:372 (-) Transcript_12242:159-1274(-)
MGQRSSIGMGWWWRRRHAISPCGGWWCIPRWRWGERRLWLWWGWLLMLLLLLTWVGHAGTGIHGSCGTGVHGTGCCPWIHPRGGCGWRQCRRGNRRCRARRWRRKLMLWSGGIAHAHNARGRGRRLNHVQLTHEMQHGFRKLWMSTQQTAGLIRVTISHLLEFGHHIIHFSLAHSLDGICHGLRAPDLIVLVTTCRTSWNATRGCRGCRGCGGRRWGRRGRGRHVHAELSGQSFEMGGIAEIDADPSPIEFVIIHVPNGRQGRLWILKFNKGKAPRFARLNVRHHAHFHQTTYLRKGLMQLLLRRRKGQISHKNIMLLRLILLLHGWRRQCLAGKVLSWHHSATRRWRWWTPCGSAPHGLVGSSRRRRMDG